ncbi:hypothetical protein FOI42_RS04020 [Escherichia coli]|nr:hypothetical protein [Escherichia coli]EFL4883702.1 hypothetical protein [Escherichia coli]MED6699478.1 hypothetical protein [Escherichia coli O157]USL83593.1 hypothetical protein A4_517 [Escherichia phage A4]HCQ0858513.1 hypothetical protein [Escherichia coli]
MKIVGVAWMLMNDGTKGFEEYAILENVNDLKHFKKTTDDDTFDIVYTYQLIPNDTDYEAFEYDSDLFNSVIMDSAESLDENAVLLMLSTVPAM